ncbi:MAG: hypothetical protein QOJ19_2481 [Acidimicrobiia bacterium]|nr:hypothetical protein [Acidimicrobiia bacterium]
MSETSEVIEELLALACARERTLRLWGLDWIADGEKAHIESLRALLDVCCQGGPTQDRLDEWAVRHRTACPVDGSILREQRARGAPGEGWIHVCPECLRCWAQGTWVALGQAAVEAEHGYGVVAHSLVQRCMSRLWPGRT